MKKIVLFILLVGVAFVCFAQELPNWVRQPGRLSDANWVYFSETSDYAVTERLARDMAHRNVSNKISQTIASDIKGRVEDTRDLVAWASEDADQLTMISEAFITAITVNVRGMETVENLPVREENPNTGRLSNRAYVLVRVPRSQILVCIQGINPEAAVDKAIVDSGVPRNSISPEVRAQLIKDMTVARDRLHSHMSDGGNMQDI